MSAVPSEYLGRTGEGLIQRLSAKRLSAAVLAALAVVAFSCERDPERDPALSESAAPEGELEPRPPAEGDGASPAAPAELDRVALGQTICPQRDSDQALAQNYVEGRYAFSPHPEVDLGTSLSWDEDPLEDNNWRFQLHTLRWLWPLVGATEQSGDTRYLEHAYSMARSWVRSNPFDDPAGDFAWNDHSTAWRTKVLGCLSMQGTPPEWLVDALVEHRDRLADPDFYVRYGNHALNQDGGLLVAACLTGDDDRRDLAMERIAVLAQESVDAEGVTDEQAVEYQDYNHFRYSDALQLIQDCGMPTPPWADRISSMLPVLAHMTLPDGTYVPLGDTDRRPAKPADHPNMRWVSTEGEEGEPPAEIFVTYHAGFSFARSGWGTDRDHLDEHHLSVRHGEPRQMHGHLDHGSVTLFADRQPLLTDPGKYRYGDLPERRHVLSAEAHNVVTIGADCAPPADRRSEVTSMASDEHVDRLTVEVATCAGTRWSRTIGFLRETGEVIVVDDVRDPSARDVVQRWQLEVGATVELLRPDLVHATWPSGSQLLIEQLAPVTTTTSLAGDPDPLRGWVSERYGELTPAANLEATAPPGDQATFITVIRPSANPRATPSTLQRSTNGFTFRVVTAAGQTRFFSHPP